MSDDIREWARARGVDIADRGRIPTAVKEAFGRREDEAGEEEAEEEAVELSPSAPPAVPSATPEPTGPPAAKVAERKPEPPTRRKRGLFSRGPAAKRAHKRVHKRVSIENIVGSGWGLAAMALMRSPKAVPVGRIMQMQAPVAGAVVEDVAKGTIVDKFLQPFARGGEKSEAVFALAGPPLIVAAISNRPELYQPLRPMLKMAMMSWLRIAGPAVKKAQKEQEKFAEEFGDVDLDGMIDALWAEIPAGPPSPQEEEHIRRARGE